MSKSRNNWIGILASLPIGMAAVAPASAQQQKPNILVIMADDIGYWNISAYNRGMMGYRGNHRRDSGRRPPLRQVGQAEL